MTKKNRNRGAREPTDTTPAEKRERFREQYTGCFRTWADELPSKLEDQADGTIAYGADECVPVVSRPRL